MKICSESECGNLVYATGLCSMHYGRKRRGSRMDTPPQKRLPALLRDAAGNKLCRDCLSWLPTGKIGPSSKSSDGMSNSCRDCRSMYYRLRKYSMSRLDFDEMLISQGSSCAICRTTEPKGRGWCVDHDHDCCPGQEGTCGGCIRGILCSPCNAAIGAMGDSADNLLRAAKYLMKGK